MILSICHVNLVVDGLSETEMSMPNAYQHQPRLALLISREHVESREHQPVLDALLAMTQTAAAVRAHASNVELVFDGYDDDQREVYLIPEVRAFVRELNERFPYWLHFDCKSEASLFCIMAALIPIEEVAHLGGEVRLRFKAGSKHSQLLSWFGAMNGLYARFGLSDEENADMTRQVRLYLESLRYG